MRLWPFKSSSGNQESPKEDNDSDYIEISSSERKRRERIREQNERIALSRAFIFSILFHLIILRGPVIKENLEYIWHMRQNIGNVFRGAERTSEKKAYIERLNASKEMQSDELAFYLDTEYLAGGVKNKDRLAKNKEKVDKKVQALQTKAQEETDRLKILEELMKEQGGYKEGSAYINEIETDGEGNCEAKAKKMSAMAQKIYPDMPRKFQFYGDHVRALAEVKGQWYALEGSRPIPIDLEDQKETVIADPSIFMDSYLGRKPSVVGIDVTDAPKKVDRKFTNTYFSALPPEFHGKLISYKESLKMLQENPSEKPLKVELLTEEEYEKRYKDDPKKAGQKRYKDGMVKFIDALRKGKADDDGFQDIIDRLFDGEKYGNATPTGTDEISIMLADRNRMNQEAIKETGLTKKEAFSLAQEAHKRRTQDIIENFCIKDKESKKNIRQAALQGCTDFEPFIHFEKSKSSIGGRPVIAPNHESPKYCKKVVLKKEPFCNLAKGEKPKDPEIEAQKIIEKFCLKNKENKKKIQIAALKECTDFEPYINFETINNKPQGGPFLIPTRKSPIQCERVYLKREPFCGNEEGAAMDNRFIDTSNIDKNGRLKKNETGKRRSGIREFFRRLFR